MGLPPVPLPTDVVMVAGVEVPVRGLSRSEVLKIAQYKDDADAAENFILACGVGVSEVEVRDWRESVPPEAAEGLVDRICVLSGLVEGAQKSS